MAKWKAVIFLTLTLFTIVQSQQAQNIGYINIIQNAATFLSGKIPEKINYDALTQAALDIDQSNLVSKLIEAFIIKNNNSSADGIQGYISNMYKIYQVFKTTPNATQILKDLLEAGNYPTNITMKDVGKTLLGLQLGSMFGAPQQSKISDQCIEDTMVALSGIRNGETWALKMIDAMGKIPVGLMEGNLKSIGSFDECQAVQANVFDKRRNVMTHPFRGKYCTFGVPITQMTDMTDMMSYFYMLLYFGVCIPESCSKDDMMTAVDGVLALIPMGNNTNYTLKGSTPNCQERDIEFDASAIAAIIVSAFFVALMVIGTAYDIIYVQCPKKKAQSNKKKYAANGLTESDKLKNIPSVSEKADLETGLTLNGISGNSKSFETVKQPNGTMDKIVGSVEDTVSEPGIAGKLILSFSVYTNGKKILNTNQGSSSITSINGIRFISMTWVILGHTYAFVFNSAGNLATYYPDIIGRWSFNAISNALISVDTFFALSGLLMSYLILKEMKKKKGACGINWGLFYFHRFWRLTPAYMLVLFVYVTLFQYWGDGPIYPQKSPEPDQCEAWWTNLLYVNNLVRTDKMCFGWAWYLANDMQFYVISPLLFIPLFYNEIIGVIMCILFLIGTTVGAGAVSYMNKLPPSSIGGGEKGGGTESDYMNEYYFKPWCRMGPYIVGILAGYFMYKTKCQLRINKYLNIVLWLLTTAIGLAILYGLYDALRGNSPLTVGVSTFYNATHRSAWGFCVCWVIVSCATGHGGYINTLLSWRGFIPLSRLTYCAYLVHPIIMYYFYFSVRQPLYLTDQMMIMLFFGYLVASYLVAFVVSLAFESPMMGLEKIMFGRGSNKKSNKLPPQVNGQQKKANGTVYNEKM